MDTQTPLSSSDTGTPAQRISALAKSLDCIAEPDFCLLADITPSTADSWRRRGKGPAYVLIGNRYLYPRQAVADFIKGNVRERRARPVVGVL